MSEVMLQQTQVERVISKYQAWTKQFPTVKKLAAAKGGEVIRAWAGLGYNRRALFLQRAAQMIMSEYGGRFPNDLDRLKRLPGVGDYTARAILSFAFDQPVAVLDTNHRTFYRRTFFHDRPMSDRQLVTFADTLVGALHQQMAHHPRPSIVYEWNQAIMDLMSALRLRPHQRGGFVGWYQETYTETKTQSIRKKPAVPFRETDRYYRGRIVDWLRGEAKISLASVQAKFSQLPPSRFENIVTRLTKAGLILQKGEDILLP